MWIKILKNYPGKDKQIRGLEGISVQEGREFDLPDNIAKLLCKTRYAEKTLAPWAKKLNPLQPQIDAYRKDMAKLKQEILKKQAALKHAEEIAATIKTCEQEIEELFHRRAGLLTEIENFANKNEIPLKDIANGIQELQTPAAGDSGEKTEDAGNSAGQAADAGEKSELSE